MFTGLIEEIGKIKKIERKSNTAEFEISCKKLLNDIALGDSISVNGVCLTVKSFDDFSFLVDVMKSTLDKTYFRCLREGDFVNLESALRFDSKLGGHLVSGHIDVTGVIESITKLNKFYNFRISLENKFLKYILPQGSVSLNGISLTISKKLYSGFEVSIIPTTYNETILKYNKIGDSINIEFDMIGKYVEQFVLGKNKSDLSISNLIKKGF